MRRCWFLDKKSFLTFASGLAAIDILQIFLLVVLPDAEHKTFYQVLNYKKGYIRL